ncbi:MAG TPA: hypothetical protein VK549_14085 [Acidimicrobiia bacterium]|nr:hypothetical protein [Acidimicrobiia bacterium]
MSTSTIDHLETAAPRQVRQLRALHLLTTLVLVVIIALGVLDGFGVVPAYGVDVEEVSATGGGYELAVEYAAVSRPALATPLYVRVRREDGFGQPIELALSQQYLTLFDENGISPAPSAETSSGEFLLWEFDPPVGDMLTVYLDARIEPQMQHGRTGVAAVIEDDTPVVSVEFHTALRP